MMSFGVHESMSPWPVMGVYRYRYYTNVNIITVSVISWLVKHHVSLHSVCYLQKLKCMDLSDFHNNSIHKRRRMANEVLSEFWVWVCTMHSNWNTKYQILMELLEAVWVSWYKYYLCRLQILWNIPWFICIPFLIIHNTVFHSIMYWPTEESETWAIVDTA